MRHWLLRERIVFIAEENNKTWNILWERQLQNLQGIVHSRFTRNLQRTRLSPFIIPTKEKLCIAPGWKLVLAEQEYLTDEQWFAHLAKKEFPVTDYIRPKEHRDFTPLPDLFHDFFGHLAFMQDQDFAQLAKDMGDAFWKTHPDRRHIIARLWWYTAEFGLLKENGVIKHFGAGLISSPEECEKAKNVHLHVPFSLEAIAKTPKAVFETHAKFFVIDSFEDIRDALDAHLQNEHTLRTNQ